MCDNYYKMTTLTEQLRAETAEHHSAIEAVMPDFGHLSVETYGGFLKRMAGFYLPIEDRLHQCLPEMPVPLLRRSDWLKADLEALQASLPMVLCSQLPAMATPSQAMGVFYVLEGASLGGQMICKTLSERFPDKAMHFYRGLGTETGARWRQCCAVLNDPRWQAEETIASAQQTFECLMWWLRDEAA